MNKIKVIDLLNMISKGEEVPKKVKYTTHYWEYREEEKDYKDNEDYYVFGCSNYDIPYMLNNEVEILEEEKKIPEKLEDKARFQYSAIPTWLEKKEIIKALNENFEKHQKAIYEIIDYLKSKGE